MKISELIIPELEQEVALTQKFLNRIPDDKMNWRPHEKSMTIQELGNHLAEIPGWVAGTMETEGMSMDDYKPSQNNTSRSMVDELNANAAAAKKALQKDDRVYTDQTWKMEMGGKTLFEMPKLKVLRSVVLGLLPHHRAQLGVYFRLLDIPVPGTYGPSADEQ